jgi:hypothetical protein
MLKKALFNPQNLHNHVGEVYMIWTTHLALIENSLFAQNLHNHVGQVYMISTENLALIENCLSELSLEIRS